MIAAYSSAVPLRRLLEAIRGTSLAMWICEKWPSGVKTRSPFGVSPNGNDFLPSGAVISATTKVQVPTSWSRRLLLCCAVALPKVSASVNAAAAICMSLMMSSEVACCEHASRSPDLDKRPLLRLESRCLRDPVGLLDLGLEIDAEGLGRAANALDTEIGQALPDGGIVEPLVDSGVEPVD